MLSLPLCVIGMLCCNSNNEFNEKSDTSLSDEESEVLDFLTEVEMNYIKNFFNLSDKTYLEYHLDRLFTIKIEKK